MEQKSNNKNPKKNEQKADSENHKKNEQANK